MGNHIARTVGKGIIKTVLNNPRRPGLIARRPSSSIGHGLRRLCNADNSGHRVEASKSVAHCQNFQQGKYE